MNKGFSLIEMMLVLIILALLNLLALRPMDLSSLSNFLNVYFVEQEYMQIKTDSFDYLEKQCLMSHFIEQSHNVCINKRGNINQAITLRIVNSDKTMVLHLGSGVYEIK